MRDEMNLPVGEQLEYEAPMMSGHSPIKVVQGSGEKKYYKCYRYTYYNTYYGYYYYYYYCYYYYA